MRKYNFGFLYGRFKYFRTAQSRRWLRKYVSPTNPVPSEWFTPRYKLRRLIYHKRFGLYLKLDLFMDYLAGFNTSWRNKRRT